MRSFSMVYAYLFLRECMRARESETYVRVQSRVCIRLLIGEIWHYADSYFVSAHELSWIIIWTHPCYTFNRAHYQSCSAPYINTCLHCHLVIILSMHILISSYTFIVSFIFFAWSISQCRCLRKTRLTAQNRTIFIPMDDFADSWPQSTGSVKMTSVHRTIFATTPHSDLHMNLSLGWYLRSSFLTPRLLCGACQPHQRRLTKLSGTYFWWAGEPKACDVERGIPTNSLDIPKPWYFGEPRNRGSQNKLSVATFNVKIPKKYIFSF